MEYKKRIGDKLTSVKVLEILPKFKNKVIVDNGCGDYNLVQLSKDMGIKIPDVICSDASIYGGSKPDILADGYALSFKKKSVDVFISLYVLEHLGYPDKYLKEMYRSLKYGGKVIIAVPVRSWYYGRIFYIRNYFTYFLLLLKRPELLRHPIKSFLDMFAHGKSLNWDGGLQDVTILDEMQLWKDKKWGKLFSDAGFVIISKSYVSNFFNLHLHRICKGSFLKNKLPVAALYILEKV